MQSQGLTIFYYSENMWEFLLVLVFWNLIRDLGSSYWWPLVLRVEFIVVNAWSNNQYLVLDILTMVPLSDQSSIIHSELSCSRSSIIHSNLSCSQVHKVRVLCHIIFFLNIGLRKIGKLDYIVATTDFLL